METLVELDRKAHDEIHRIVGFFCESFDALCKRIESLSVPLKLANGSHTEMIPQKNGRPRAISNTGEMYIEFFESMLCRDADFDIQVAKRTVAMKMGHRLGEYLSAREGTIFWRIRPEDDLIDAPQVIRYDEDGPDKDFYTDKKCFLDKRWKKYGIYMRLLRSAKPELDECRPEMIAAE